MNRAGISRLIHQLPEHAVARLYVDARLAGRVLASTPVPEKEDDRKGLALLKNYIAALESGGRPWC